MTKVSFKNLLNKLSVIGLDKLDIFNAKNRSRFLENINGLCSALLQLKGEASSLTIAEEVIENYQASSAEEKLEFFQYLNEVMQADSEEVAKAITSYQESGEQAELQRLRAVSEAPRQELFRILNTVPRGTDALISMREDLLGLLPDHPELKPVDQDFMQLFRTWFNRGFLELRRFDWQTPAVILEKLIEYESVHEIQGWPDLRRRLEADRRCFGFFHPVIPDEPLIFVEVALTNELSANIKDLLNQPPPHKTPAKGYSHAIFYSINNCLKGLRGVSFGNFLIKQVVDQLAREMPGMSLYATLSPVPGFMKWIQRHQDELEILEEEQRQMIAPLMTQDAKSRLKSLQENPELEPLLMQLCAHYLVEGKSRGKPADPVARFHLGNGAQLERINWQGDLSENGLQQSAGIMVNYLYDRKTLARNHEAYEQDGRVAYSNEVKKLLS